MTHKIPPLSPEELALRCEPDQFDFTTTEGLVSKEDLIGQERAIEALEYGLSINHKGYNVYVMGPPGLGKHTLVNKMLSRKALLGSPKFDWCYVYNFSNPLKPRALKLPAGRGKILQEDMEEFIEKLHINFSDIIVLNTIDTLKLKYAELPDVILHLDDLYKNILKNAKDFMSKPRENLTLFDQPHIETPPYSRLKVNLFVDNSQRVGCPVIFEDNPIYHNLIGRVDNMSISGSLISDFTLIRPGSLHRANHGYLILDMFEVLTHDLAWEGLKRALHTQEIRIEPLEQSLEFWSAQTLDPEPIPLDIKIILIGDRETYYTLTESEPDFGELFKVITDFENDMPRNQENQQRYAEMIGSMSKEHHLKPLDSQAVATIIDYSSRLVEDKQLLSTNIHKIRNIVQQSDYWAGLAQRHIIEKQDVEQAILRRTRRINRIQENTYTEIQRGFIMIQTDGHRVGQMNALTIVELGQHEFGQPSKVTATIHVGEGEVIDIQREVDLTGSIFTKGVLTLTGFIKGRYAMKEKLSLSASIALEQLYSPIDGDSASGAELCALLSALANTPINQSFAMTGSVSQFGELQAISGVNQKIEGFFEICNFRKLTGKQGVIIPKVNVQNLMLNNDVIHAAKKGLFHIYAVDTIDEAMSILTDLPIGERNANGHFPRNSLNYKVEYRLRNYAKIIRKNSSK